MRTRVQISAVVLLTATFALAGAALEQRIQRVENGLLRAVVVKGQPRQKLDLRERLKHHRVPGASVAVVERGRIEWARGYGERSAGGGPAVTPDTLFQAASISKPVAAMVALRLVEMGQLALDEDVNLKLRSWKVPGSDQVRTETVTLRRLLSHTAGLTVHGFPGYAAGAEVPTLRQLLDGVRPANTAPIRADIVPGSRWRYSGGGYEVMQQLVEDVTGKLFPQVARELVLGPLGMEHSTYEQPPPEWYAARAATGHRGDGGAIPGKWHTYPEMAAAGLWTTPSDLCRVILEIQKPGKVLKPATVRDMLTAVLGNYGLGFSLGERAGRKSFSHGGSNEGFRCGLFAYRDSGDGAVVMTNGDRGGSLAGEILSSIAAEYGWADYKPRERTVITVAAEALRSYAGKYQLPGGPLVTVTAGDGCLKVESSRGLRAELLPETENLFFDADGGVPDVRFVRKDDGSTEMAIGGQSAKRM